MSILSAEPPETKVTLTGVAGLIVTAIFGSLATWAPGFVPPPAWLVSAFVTLAGFAVGYMAPHTTRLSDVVTPGSPGVVITPLPKT